uniref:Ligand dependent nuclear receptor corepressor-like n=1 Tax=Oryzias latipes TaxID=8090 RepID=A0A3P9H3D5_ORYLA
MAAVQCSKCTAERKGFRRELDSWRHRLIHCVGFETILEGIYGPMLLKDLSLFVDCEPEEVDDWSPETSRSHCSFCKLLLEKLSDQEAAPTSPLSPPSHYSSCQGPTISDSSHSAQRFLHAVFHKKDVTPDCDSSIPLVAQELMKKMIHQFAVEYASKCTNVNYISRASSPSSEASDAPLDLTVSRTQEEKEDQPEIDGALDLSKRNCATSSSNHKPSGSQRPSLTEELGDVCLRGTKVCPRTALEAVLRSLCPAHQSLLHQIVKAAHQAQLMSFMCLSHAENPLDKVSPRSIPLSGCKARNCRQHCPLSECDHQSHCNPVCGPEDSQSCWNIHHASVRDCSCEGHWGSSCICVWRCRTDSCESLCSKRLHCVCRQSLSVTPINNVVSSPASPPLLPMSTRSTPPPRFCSSCHQHCSCLSCSCHWSNLCQTQAKYSVEKAVGDGEHHCSVLNREHSPSPPPPPLSPIPSDINKTNDEKPPSLLHHRQVGEAGVMIRNSLVGGCLMAADPGKEYEPQPQNPVSRQAETNTSGTLLQDVVSRFSEKLETIAPAERDSEKEEQQFPSTSQSLPFHGDAHLTEIITRVLHSGSASDYSLSELFNRHDSGEPKSPNTRLRRRQEVLAAISRPADDASTRRQKLQIKRYFAMFDKPNNRRKESPAKKRLQDPNSCAVTSDTLSNSNLVTEMSKTETMVGLKPVENHGENCASAETDQDDVKEDFQEVIVTEKLEIVKDEVKDLEICDLKKDLGIVHAPIPELQKAAEDHSATATSASQCEVPNSEDSKAPSDTRKRESEEASSNQQAMVEELVKEEHGSSTNHLNGMRRSTRNIMPPQRFSSYVTAPRKMLFVACFSDGIFNNTTQNKTLTPDALQTCSKSKNTNITQDNAEKEASQCSPKETEILESTQTEEPWMESKGHGQLLSQTLPIKEKNGKKQSKLSPEKTTIISDSALCGRLRTSPRRLVSMMSKNLVDVDGGIKPTSDSPFTSRLQYSSPIKLMFVSPVKDQEGVKYSLKSTGGGSSTQIDHFDPCEESSWSGTPQKHKRQTSKRSPSPLKSHFSPQKSSSPAKPVPSSPSSPPKSVSSPRSASSSPKSGHRRSGQSSPTKHLSESDQTQSDLVSVHETTPPKRRPGRPKKLGPQLEQKVKRPIGRPRKQKDLNAAVEAESSNPKASTAAPIMDNVTKNLKVTVVYGRSRRNKRMVSEGIDQLQTDFSDSLLSEDLKSDFLTQRSKNNSVGNNENAEEINFATPEKQLVPLRKPGRPAKVKITGISVTVTTVSPRLRQIQLNKDVQPPSETQQRKKVLLPGFKSLKEPRETSHKSLSETSQKEVGLQTRDSHEEELSDESVALRHSNRVRKPSIHFLHAVATSPFRLYSRSNALLRRSKQLLLTKASNERRQEEKQSDVEMCGEKPPLHGQKRRASQDLSRVAGVSVDSIFSPKKPLKWWSSSAEEKAVNQELARRIQVITDTWVSDNTENKQRGSVGEPKQDTKGHSSSPRKSKQFSVVRTLFDCPLNKPRSCSMQQIHSWFMQTTETHSLAIVKKNSSRNPFEVMHFPRSANKNSVCPSPQAERLRRHTKKFATAVPQSPLQHQRAQQRLRKARACKVMRQLFAIRTEGGKGNCRVWVSKSSSGKFQANLFRAKMRFLTKIEKEQWLKRSDKRRNRTLARSCPRRSGLQPDYKRLHRSVKDGSYGCFRIGSATCCVEQTLEPLGERKEQKLCSKAWSPETLKECRVFLRKINSPNNESAEEGWNSCTVTLDDGSPSAYLFAGKERELRGVVKASKSQRKRNTMKKTASREPSSPLPKSVQMKDSAPAGRQKDKPKSHNASTDLAQPPPAKTLRQSRMRGLTGLKWRDFVFGK